MWKTVLGYFPQILRGKTVAAAGAQSVVTKFLIIALNTSTSVLTARMLGPEGRGEQAAMVLWQFFLASSLSFGLSSSLIYNLKRDPEAESELFGTGIVIGITLGCLAAAVGVFLIPYWLTQYSPVVVRQAQFFMLNAPVVMLMLVFRAGFEARGDYAASNKTLLFTPLLTLIGLILLVPTGALTSFTSSIMYVFAPLPVTVWIAIRLWKLYRPKLSNFKRRAGELFHYGVRSYGIDLLGTLAVQIDQILIAGFLHPGAMGMYVVAVNLARMLVIFQTSAVMVLFPKIAARPVEEVVEVTGRAARISLAVTVLAGFAMLLAGSFLLRLIYGAEYLEAVPTLNILIIEGGFGGTAWLLAQSFMAVGKPGWVAILQGVGLSLSVPLSLVLVPHYGMLGIALALLCSAVVRLLFVQLAHPLLLKVPPPSLILKRGDLDFLRRSFSR